MLEYSKHIKHDKKIYAKVTQNHPFISIDENHKNCGQQPVSQIRCIPLGMCPLTFYRKEAIEARSVRGLV